MVRYPVRASSLNGRRHANGPSRSSALWGSPCGNRSAPGSDQCSARLHRCRLCPTEQTRLGNYCMVGRQTRQRGVVRMRDSVMKIILTAILALSVLAGVAAPAGAVDGREQYEQDRTKY